MARARKKKEEIQYTINMALPHESNARLAAYKAKKPSSQKPMKMCIRCKQVLPLTAFYSNKGNREGKFTDIYCKECAQKMCKDKESVKKYFWDNNRLWKEVVWEKAQEKAEVALSANTGYLDKRITNEQRARKLERETALKCLTQMNYVWAYEYVQNTRLGADGEEEPLSGELLNPEDVPEDDPTVYSKVWNGYYRQSDIEYLDDYYSQLEDAFVLDNINIQDYARKVAKASLIADRKYNEMRNGGGSPKEWQDAQSAFDAMCKSANFAACQRKDQGGGGLGSLAKIIEDIEINHRADMPEVHFPPDDVDKILQDFRHTFTATQ